MRRRWKSAFTAAPTLTERLSSEARRAAIPRFHLTDTVPVKFGTRWERLTCTLKVRPARGGEPVIQLPRILLSTVKANQMIYFGPITVTVPAGKEGAE